MQIGFEMTAAVPKRLRAAEDAPVAQSMRGERRITQAPSTDQKKVRREMQRKTADLDTEAKIYGEESRVRCPDCGAKERKQTWTGYGTSNNQRNHGWACGSCGHHYTAPVREERIASAGDVAEHDDVQAKDEFDSDHVEPGGGKHHHHPRTAMNSYLALMNDVGDCRSCGGDLVKDPGQRGDTTVTAHCKDCGMEHQLQDSGQRTASLHGLTARQVRHLEVLASIFEVEHSSCPDCGSKGWGTKDSDGHANSSEHGFRWRARCRDCGHHYEVARDDAAANRHSRFGSLVWEPISRYLPDPHKHMSAIARRAQSVLDTEEIQ